MTFSNPTLTRDTRALSGSFTRAAALLARHGTPHAAQAAAEATGASRDAIAFLRSKSIASTTNADWAAALADEGAVSGFVEALRSTSAFASFVTLANNFPPRSRVAVWGGLPVAVERTAEGEPYPVLAGTLDRVVVEARDVGGLVVASREVLDADALGLDLLRRELLRAASAGLDSAFVAEITDGLTPINGSASSPLPALRQALAAAVPSGGSRPMWIAGAGAARALATAEAAGGLLFPTMTATGGMLLGYPAAVCDHMASPSHLVLLDGAGWAVAPIAVDVATSQAGAVRLGGTGGELISLFQSHLVALRVVASFGVERLRDNAAALVNLGTN